MIGGKYVRLLQKQLDALRAEDVHGNRRLLLDDVFVTHLLAFFTPSIRSLRTIEDFSQTRQAQKHLSISKICKSTLSDFHRLVDPERLTPILDALRGQLSRKQARQGKGRGELAELLQQVVAVDGTWLPAMADVAWAVANKNNHHATRHRARLDAHVNVASGLPELLVVPEPNQSEPASAVEHLRPDRLCLYDRGFVSFELVRAHHEQGGWFVARYKPAGVNSPELSHTADAPLSDDDHAAGVQSDRTGRFDTETARRVGIEAVELREVTVRVVERKGETTLRLVTNLTGVSASTIAQLYRRRWQAELFFRWLKSLANFDHLISHCREGMQAYLYVAIIAAMLMYLHTGCRPSKYLFAMLGQVAAGGATLDEVLPILRERERRSELDRQSRARRAAKKKVEGK